MNSWNCCRTCLEVQSLCPIFTVPEHSEKYTEVILTAAGIKVELNDSLPQEMCTSCISFINVTYKFRKKCIDNQKRLWDQISVKNVNNITLESNNIKTEKNCQSIDISDLLDDFKSLNDDNDSINDYADSIEDKNEKFDFQSKMQEIVEKPVESIMKQKEIKKKVEKPSRRKLKSKKDIGQKKVKVKEEIECEYCHKILTSKLSIRNHYKIHTGFDVVCEHCGKKFITRRLLLMHCRAKHGYEKTDKCSYCEYRASNAEQVKIHERIHTGEKPYVCSSCGAGFHRKSSYLQHVAIHLPDKTVQCDQCPARFKSVTLMRIHKNRHRAPQYSFKCRVCDNNFARRRNVARHLQRIHGLQSTQELIDRLKIPQYLDE